MPDHVDPFAWMREPAPPPPPPLWLKPLRVLALAAILLVGGTMLWQTAPVLLGPIDVAEG